MNNNQLMECWQGDTACPVPTQHRIRVEYWEYGPDAGEDRFGYLHHVLKARRDIHRMENANTTADAIWSLMNVGRSAGLLRNTALDDFQALCCAMYLGHAFIRKLYYLEKEITCQDAD